MAAIAFLVLPRSRASFVLLAQPVASYLHPCCVNCCLVYFIHLVMRAKPTGLTQSSRIDQESIGNMEGAIKNEEHGELNTQITQYKLVCSQRPESPSQ
jgi:hypothetical protein